MPEISNKLRMLYVLDILRRESDEMHPLSAMAICGKLMSQYDIRCARKATIYEDINALIAFKDNYFNIEKVNVPRKGFCIFDREFELPELYFLCDAVQSAPFITKRKAQTLIKKLETFSSVYQGNEISKTVYIDNRHKCRNNTVYINIDHIHKAIAAGRKAEIIYEHTQLGSGEKKKFTVSPYAMIWSNDHYYLICNNDTKENLMHIRIDRIKSVGVLKDAARSFELFTDYKGRFNTADYANKMFNAFAGEPEDIVLLCENSIYQEISDRFGEGCIKKYDTAHFKVKFSAALSNGLVNWILPYADKIVILEPQNLRSLFNNKLEDICEFQKKEKF